MKVKGALLLSVLAGAASGLACRYPTLGPEFLVNTTTADAEFLPSLASDGHGNFVVVWETYSCSGSYPCGSVDINGQRHDWLGSKVGTEFPVNTFATGVQKYPEIADTSNGSFVVVWESKQDGSSNGILGQRFAVQPSINPLQPGVLVKNGTEFSINTYTTGDQVEPAVAGDASGNFVVVWQSAGQDGSGPGIFAQRYDSSGNASGSEFQVNTYTTDIQKAPAIASAADGSSVVVWWSWGQDGSGWGIYGQRVDRSGVKVGPEFPVTTRTAAFQAGASVASAPNGNFVVVWKSDDQDGSDSGVFGQRFDSAGNRVGSEFQVNTYTTGRQTEPSVAMKADGSFVVVWESYGQDGDQPGIFGQQFDRFGQPLGAEFPVNTYTTSSQAHPRVVNDGSGFVVVWTSNGQDGSGYAVVGRRVDAVAAGVAVDSRSAGGTVSDTNGVLEPGETVLVAPQWANQSGSSFGDFAGGAAAFTGPSGGTYGQPDTSASYGTLPSGTLGSCDDGSADACYQVSVSGPRPATHWDTTLEELIFEGWHPWTLHVGDSFADVPRSQPFYKKIETVLHAGITSGCDTTHYCPGKPVTRDQMAIFLAKALAGGGEYVPPRGFVSGIAFGSSFNCAAGGNSLFTDVKPTDAFCKHVHHLAARNVTLGCGNFQYCPGPTVTRDAMASFIAKAIVAPKGGDGVPVSFSGPAGSYSCDAGSPNIHFTDVPASNPFCKHIHYLWAKGIVTGCTATKYCPSDPVNRDAMAKFLANGFGLGLYGP